MRTYGRNNSGYHPDYQSSSDSSALSSSNTIFYSVSESSEATSLNSSPKIESLSENKSAIRSPPVLTFMDSKKSGSDCNGAIDFAKDYLHSLTVVKSKHSSRFVTRHGIHPSVHDALEAFIKNLEKGDSGKGYFKRKMLKSIAITMCNSCLGCTVSIPLALSCCILAISQCALVKICCCYCLDECKGEIYSRSEHSCRLAGNSVCCGGLNCTRFFASLAEIPWIACCPLKNPLYYLRFNKYMDEKIDKHVGNIIDLWRHVSCNFK